MDFKFIVYLVEMLVGLGEVVVVILVLVVCIGWGGRGGCGE